MNSFRQNKLSTKNIIWEFKFFKQIHLNFLFTVVDNQDGGDLYPTKQGHITPMRIKIIYVVMISYEEYLKVQF